MVKVEYMKDVELREWYWEVVCNIMNKKKKKNKSTPQDDLEKIWVKRLTDNKVLYDIIFEELSVLVLKYEWIKEYVDKCGKNDYVMGNNIISKYINGKMLSKEIRFALMEKMNVRVCPYCNQQYVYAIRYNKHDGQYLGDLDHVMPKQAYPLFALSLWNLVPSCKSCNQLFKRNHKKEILSPIEEGFDEDCILRIKYHSVNAIKGSSLDFDVEWNINDCTDKRKKKQKMANNIDVFKLNDLYKEHKREIRSILWKKAICSNKAYQNSLNSIIKSLSGGEMKIEDFLYGMNISERKFSEQPHSKMIYDIVKYN